jgi:hypothetical protein
MNGVTEWCAQFFSLHFCLAVPIVILLMFFFKYGNSAFIKVERKS